MRFSGARSTLSGGEAPQHREVEVADARHRRAVDEVVDLRQGHQRARLERARRGSAAPSGSTRRTAAAGASGVGHLHHARGEAAAADGDHQEVGGGELVEDLERAGRLALDHVGVVEGRQEEGAGLGGEGLGGAQRLVEIVADEADLDPAAAELAGLVDLLLRGGAPA